MKQVSNVLVREWPKLRGRVGALIIGLAAILMVLGPLPARAQWAPCGSGECITSGSVGIGTTSPTDMLDVAGTIAAQQIKVEASVPDYVFEPTYHLQPLSEVKQFVEEHHHLPDIPSTAEVKEKGLNIGEMQAKLLGKIEELTLHMIQAEEHNNRLEQQNSGLQEQVKSLQERLEQVAAANGSTANK